MPLRIARWGFRVLGPAAPELASAYAETLFRTARRHPRPAWERALLDSGTAFRVPWRESYLPAWSWGDGPLVLLVHGWEGRGSQLGALVGPLVDRGFRVIAFDGPGHGDSPTRRSGPVDHACAISAIVDHLGPVHAIVAHSVGGFATTLAAAKRRHTRDAAIARRFVFVAPPVNPSRFTREFSSFFEVPEAVRAAMIARLEARYRVPMARLDAVALAPQIEEPLLVIHDDADRDVPIADGRALAAAWPASELIITAGLGHRRVLRAPNVIDAIVRYVSRDAPRSIDEELFHRESRYIQ